MAQISLKSVWRSLFLRELLARFLLYALPIGLATAITVYFFYHLDVQMSEEDIHHTEQHHLDMRREMISAGIHGVASDLRVLREMVLAHAEQGETAGDFSLEEALEHFDIYCREFSRYQTFRILDEDGAETARVVCSDDGQQVHVPSTVRENLRMRPWTGILDLNVGEIWVSRLSVGSAAGSGDWFQPQVAFASVLAVGPTGKRHFVVAGLSMRTLITELLIDTGEGGTMLLVDRAGTLVGRPKGVSTASRSQWWGIGFQDLFPEVWQQLWSVQGGEVESESGLFTFTTLNPAEILRRYQVSGAAGVRYPASATEREADYWKVISHVPHEELIAARERFAQKFMLLAPILLIAPLFGSWYLAQHAVRRRHVVRELADNERYLRQIVDNVLDGIVTTDADGAIERQNAVTAKLFNLPPDAAASNIDELIPRTSLGDANPVDRSTGDGIPESHPPLRFELELTRSDGTRFPTELIVMSSSLSGQQRLIWVIRDITERRELERKHESERLRFFHRTKMAEVGLLAAGIIHEVGNPIAAIQGLVEDLQRRVTHGDGTWDEPARGHLAMILEQARRLGGITRDISEYVRNRPGTQGLFDINSVIRSTARLVRYDARWKSIRLNLDLDASIPALNGIEDQMTQVIMNLLVNAGDAVQSTDPAQRRVAVASRYSAHHVEVTVEDNGHGMDEETRSQVFDSFYTTKPEGKGTGLGLTLCRSIIEAHGGTIEVASQLGAGARFRIVMPTPAMENVRIA